jgi:hypothetical protein
VNDEQGYWLGTIFGVSALTCRRAESFASALSTSSVAIAPPALTRLARCTIDAAALFSKRLGIMVYRIAIGSSLGAIPAALIRWMDFT